MKVKLDENLPRSARDVLVETGHEVDSVPEEGLTGAPDPYVVRAATEAGRLLISLDRGLGDIRAMGPGVSTSASAGKGQLNPVTVFTANP